MKASQFIEKVGLGLGVIEALSEICDFDPSLGKAILCSAVEFVYNEINDGRHG